MPVVRPLKPRWLSLIVAGSVSLGSAIVFGWALASGPAPMPAVCAVAVVGFFLVLGIVALAYGVMLGRLDRWSLDAE